jgi:hypothetical protein
MSELSNQMAQMLQIMQQQQQAQGYFLASANAYAPMASFMPQYQSGVEGLPFVGQSPMIAMIAAPFVQNLMGAHGMTAMGMNDRNIVDVLRSRQYYAQQRLVMGQLAEGDRQSLIRTMRGIAALNDQEWDTRHKTAAGMMATSFQSFAPMLGSLQPGLLDAMGGARGSAYAFGVQFQQAARSRIDPTTGSIGMSPTNAAAQSDALYKALYGGEDISGTKGIRAGELGALLGGLQSRGLATGLGAMGSTGAGAGGINVDSVKRTLGGYLDAINAVKDLFGETGNPNAPMAQIIGALEKLTAGSVGQIPQDKLNGIVRMTTALATAPGGIGIDNAMRLQDMTEAEARQRGIAPIIGVYANQAGMAWGQAYRAGSATATPMWGAASAEQAQQQNNSLNLGALNSVAGLSAAAVARLADEAKARGGLLEGSEATAYLAAMERGDVNYTFRDATGRQQTRSITLEQADVMRIAREQSSRTGGITGDQILGWYRNPMESLQRWASAATGRTARQGQLAQYQQTIASTVAMELNGLNINVGADKLQAIAGSIAGLDTADMADESTQSAAIQRILRAQGVGDDTNLGRIGGDIAQTMNVNARATGRFGNWVQYHTQMSRTTQATADQFMREVIADNEVRTLMAPLNGGGPLSRLFAALQSPDMQKPDALAKLIGRTFGGVDNGEVNAIMAEMNAVRAAQSELTTANTDMAKTSTSDASFGGKLERANKASRALEEAVRTLQKRSASHGLEVGADDANQERMIADVLKGKDAKLQPGEIQAGVGRVIATFNKITGTGANAKSITDVTEQSFESTYYELFVKGKEGRTQTEAAAELANIKKGGGTAFNTLRTNAEAIKSVQENPEKTEAAGAKQGITLNINLTLKDGKLMVADAGSVDGRDVTVVARNMNEVPGTTTAGNAVVGASA